MLPDLDSVVSRFIQFLSGRHGVPSIVPDGLNLHAIPVLDAENPILDSTIVDDLVTTSNALTATDILPVVNLLRRVLCCHCSAVR